VAAQERSHRRGYGPVFRAVTLSFLCAACAVPGAPPKVAASAPPVPKPVPPPPPEKIRVADLASFTPTDVENAFGSPSLKRSEGGTVILQFTSGRCITDMVFDENANMIHIEARAKSGTPIAIQPCLDSFAQKLPKLEDAADAPET